jgi:DNA-binding CsgD family transcriptional regulator
LARSKQLRLSDIRAVFRLLAEIQELRADSVGWQQRMILGLCDLLGMRQGASHLFTGFHPDGDVKPIEAVYAGWASSESAALWNRFLKEGGWRGDPILNKAIQVPGVLRTHLRETLIEDGQWYQSECWNEIAKPAGTDDVLVCWQRRYPSGRVRGLALQRDRHDGRLTIRQRNIFHLFNVELYRLWSEGRIDQSAPLATPSLSPRQGQLLNLLLEGKSVKETAACMGIAYRTTEDYVKALYRRFEVRSRAELLAKFIRRTDFRDPPRSR